MRIEMSDALVDYPKASGHPVATPVDRDRMSMRQALPVWLAMAVGGWLVVGLLLELLLA